MAALLLLLLLALPARVLALGDVRAVVTNNLLEVLGDGEANVLRITPGTGQGAVVVSGFEGTTVNGGAAPASLAAVDGIRITSAGGDDRMELVGLEILDRLEVKLGRGVDSIILQDVRVRGESTIKGGRDRDVVTIRGFSRFFGPLLFQGREGADEVTLTGATVSGGLRVDGGSSGDTVLIQLSALEAGGQLLVRGGAGEDLVTLVDSDFFGAVVLDLRKDDDDVRIQDCDFSQAFDADGGRHLDELDLDGDNSFAVEPSLEGFEAFN
jgi:hypothetical protein